MGERVSVSVWVEAGRSGRLLSYDASGVEPLQPGDLVRVKLRGQLHTGIVSAETADVPEGVALSPVLERLEAAAVDPLWQQMLEAVAQRCHTSSFQVLKTALPNGWLGHRRQSGGHGRSVLVAERLQPPPLSDSPTKRQQALLDHLDAHGPKPVTQLVEQGFGRALLKNLATKQWISLTPTVLKGEATLLGSQVELQEEPPELSAQQQQALQQWQENPEIRQWLLWGVTGSGKTEVYLRCCQQVLEQGQSVLLLTPEIGLVPQLLQRCRQRFGDRVISFHSGLSDGERIKAWRRCRQGGANVVVGTRSAIFLPMPQLGLIVLDEEHDSSYKQESPMPCYHARDVARIRMELEGSRLLFGSATPSLENWLLSQEDNASMGLLELRDRIAARPLPPVHVVDMRQELASGHRRLLSRPLLDRLMQLPERQEQAVVLVPRRGYSTFLSCRSCGEVVMCPHCDVALTVHRSKAGRQWLRCHWCDHREDLENRCSHCGSTAFKPFGAGTQKVLELLSQELEGLRLLRFDRDSTGGRDGHRRLLDRFAAGEADVLIGTQMLAKGMDLPRVTLAAVLAADGLLHRPDLRAGEQALQLLLQLAGRAGRGERPGQVLVQTYTPEHPVIQHLVDGRYEAFLSQEVALRKEAGLVPFSRACLLRLSGDSPSKTATAAAVLAERIRPICQLQNWWLLGPAPAPVARVAGRSRWQLLLHGPAGSPLPLPPGQALWDGLPKGVALTVDPDPQQL